ncbi:MAG: TonB-dependent siderophore receptor [Pseudoxanthomonas sp.]|nr:TonB-dependent siderophore receptor [Pseudoxanthomonas sp.]
MSSVLPSAVSPLTLAIVLALSAAPAWAAAEASVGEKEAIEFDTLLVTGVRPEGYDARRSSTATRTDTPLLDVPQSITVVSQQQIRDQAIQNMADAVRYVPGIGITQGEGNRDGLVFRGNSSTADLFVDGMRDDVQYFRDTYNIERIEAFKGPNAMIFGRGSPGGLLNRVSKVAEWGSTRAIGLQLGSWDKRRLIADIGQPLNEAAAFRVTGAYEDSESFRDGFELHRKGINPTLAIRTGESSRITVGYEYFRDERTADRGIPSIPNAVGGTRYPVDTDRSTFFGDPEGSYTWAEVNSFSALIEQDFGEGVVLRNRTRYADYDKFYQNVYPGSVIPAPGGDQVALSAYDNATVRENLFNQTDLIFSVNTGAVEHKFMTGVELGRQNNSSRRQSGLFATATASPCLAGSSASSCLVPLGSPNVSVPVTYQNNSSNGSGDARNSGLTKVAALYLQDQIEFSPHWQAIVGVRYDQFDVDFTDLRNGVDAAKRELSSSDKLWSPRAGVVYKPADNLALYASYGVTYLPRSGEQLSSLAFNTRAIKPEEFKNREIGVKWELGTDLAASAAVYRLDRSNAAVVDPIDPSRLVLLDGDSQRVEGVELSLAGKVSEAWQVIGSYAYQDGRTTQTVGSTPAGRVLSQTPRHSVGLWNRYDFSPRWGLGLGAIYRDRSFASISNAVTLKSYTRWDGALYYRYSERIQAQLNVENLLDKHYFPSAHNDNNITPGAPRSAYLSLNLNF